MNFLQSNNKHAHNNKQQCNQSSWQVESVGFKAADYDETIKKYDPERLQYGYNTVDGEEIYFIPNPALGLWINREKFNA